MAWKKDLNQDVDDDKISRINSAGIINITIENLWRDSYSCMAKGDLATWNRKLDAIWLILGGDIHDDKDPKFLEFNKLDESLYRLGSLNQKTSGFEKPNQDNQLNKSAQYLVLRNKSLFLRRLQNSQGKGTAYATDDDYDFD